MVLKKLNTNLPIAVSIFKGNKSQHTYNKTRITLGKGLLDELTHFLLGKNIQYNHVQFLEDLSI